MVDGTIHVDRRARQVQKVTCVADCSSSGTSNGIDVRRSTDRCHTVDRDVTLIEQEHRDRSGNPIGVREVESEVSLVDEAVALEQLFVVGIRTKTKFSVRVRFVVRQTLLCTDKISNGTSTYSVCGGSDEQNVVWSCTGDRACCHASDGHVITRSAHIQ